MDTCPNCGQELSRHGEQPNVVKGTMSMLGSCMNPDCENFQSTFSFWERKMTWVEAKRYDDLRERLGIHRVEDR